MRYDLSILIPSRNEEWLSLTVADIIKNKRVKTEVIVGLDGEWAKIEDHDDVRVVYYPESIGQRGMQNQLAKLSRAKYVAKVDAHCAFSEGFDVELLKTFEELGDDITVAPLMKNLQAFEWKCMKCGKKEYQGPTPTSCVNCDNTDNFKKKPYFKPRHRTPNSTSYRFDHMLHFQYFNEYKAKQEGDLVESMSLQGSFFMCTRERYFSLPLCDESWGSWGQQGSEVAIKTRLSGGKVIINKKCWYAHLFRTQPGFSFPYRQSGSGQQRARDICNDIFKNSRWEHQVYPLSSIVEQFWPVPDWSDEQLRELKQNEIKAERSGIYSIKSLSSGRIYIGSAVNIASRIFEHTRKLKQGKHSNIHLQRSWDKYGESDLEFGILYFCLPEKLIENEQRILDDHKDRLGWDMLFNMSPTAGSTLGKAHTEEGKANISASKLGAPAWNKGLTLEDERVEKYAGQIRGVPKWHDKEHPKGFLGKSHSDESKLKASESMKPVAEKRTRDINGKFI